MSNSGKCNQSAGAHLAGVFSGKGGIPRISMNTVAYPTPERDQRVQGPGFPTARPQPAGTACSSLTHQVSQEIRGDGAPVVLSR